MASSNSDFLRFSAYSLKDMITRKLSENSKFTDQIYEGSNLAILIDLVCYMYQCLVYCLNNAAAESMFSDTQYFENINRLVGLLGIPVRGCVPASITAKIESVNDSALYWYSQIDTGMIDSQGKKIYYSVAPDKDNANDPTIDLNAGIGSKNIVRLVNGKYKRYSSVFTASGTKNETFVLNLASDVEDQKYVANDYIDVWVYSDSKFIRWKYDRYGIFLKSNISEDSPTSNSSIYGYNPDYDNYFTIKLNEKKQYEIRFGDGVNGAMLPQNATIVIFYLDTNGYDGSIDFLDADAIDLSNVKFEHSPQSLGISLELYNRIFNSDLSESEINNNSHSHDCELYVTMPTTVASKFIPEQDVAEIRENAPRMFKTGNRLITKTDYEYFFKSSSGQITGIENIVDVKCMNNTEYVASLYKWLYLQGLNNLSSHNGRHYFDQAFWDRTNFKVIDPADTNNIYLWIKSSNDNFDFENIPKEWGNTIKPIKTLTSELEVVKAVDVYFDICANPSREDAIENIDENYIEVTIDDDILYVNTTVKEAIANIILKYFDINTMKLGQNVDFGSITQQIYDINGVKSVKTICRKADAVYRTYDGLSFASWSPVLENDNSNSRFVDYNVSNSGRQLEEFQFPCLKPELRKEDLINKIVIIKKTLTPINSNKE